MVTLHAKRPRAATARSGFAVRRAVLSSVLLAFSAAAFLGTSGCCGIINAGTSSPAEATSSVDTTAVSQLPSLPVTPLPLADKVLPPKAGAYLGVYTPPAPFTIERVKQFEESVGRDVAIVMWYQPWASTNRSRFDAAACLAIMRSGKVPLITWEPWDPGSDANLLKNPSKQPEYRLKAIVDGEYDAYLRQWATDIRTLGGPVMLRPMHEMNGNWYPWAGTANGNSPEQFVAAWRHIHDIFEEEGATNVTWVWSINHESVPADKKNAYAAYYPGDEYVDWTSISGFNWGTTSSYSSWRPFLHWYTKPLAYLETLDKPICVSEFGSVEQGGSKAEWIEDAYGRIKGISRVRAVVYYDSIEKSTSSTQDWRVGSSPTSLAAFRKAVASTYFVSEAPEALTEWATSLDEDDWRYLVSLTPIY